MKRPYYWVPSAKVAPFTNHPSPPAGRGDVFDTHVQESPLRSWDGCLIGAALTKTQSTASLCAVTASLSLDAVWRAVPDLLMVDAQL